MVRPRALLSEARGVPQPKQCHSNDNGGAHPNSISHIFIFFMYLKKQDVVRPRALLGEAVGVAQHGVDGHQAHHPHDGEGLEGGGSEGVVVRSAKGTLTDPR